MDDNDKDRVRTRINPNKSIWLSVTVVVDDMGSQGPPGNALTKKVDKKVMDMAEQVFDISQRDMFCRSKVTDRGTRAVTCFIRLTPPDSLNLMVSEELLELDRAVSRYFEDKMNDTMTGAVFVATKSEVSKKVPSAV